MNPTRMELYKEHDGSIVFKGRIDGYDLQSTPLDIIDIRLLKSVSGGSCADWLLGLEVLFRRIKEALATKEG